MVVHGEIWVSGSIERIPAHWRVRFGGSFFGGREAKEGEKRRTTRARRRGRRRRKEGEEEEGSGCGKVGS